MPYSAIAAVARDKQGPLRLETVELDDLQSREVLVDIEACGICHTDVKFRNQLSLPGVFGHEGVGTVAAIGSAVSSVAVGDRVVISYPWCGECPCCERSEPYRCERIPKLKFGGSRFDGSHTIRLEGDPITSSFFQQSSFATRAITLEDAVVPVDPDTDPAMLASLPCGVQTGAGAVFNTFDMQSDDSLVVFGVGTVGLSALMAARVKGVSPRIAVDVKPERLAFAKELGATHVLNAMEVDVPEEVKKICPRGVNYALETAINPKALEDAIECLAQGGNVGIFSAPPPGAKFPFTTRGLFVRVASLHGIVQGSSIPKEFIPKLVELQKQGVFPYEKLVTTYKFSEINQALEDMESGSVVKPVLVMGSEK